LGLEKKGHPLHWHEVPPSWLTEGDLDNMEEMIKERVSDIIKLFGKHVKIWDVVNEINRAKKFTDIISRYEVKTGEANVIEMLVNLVHGINTDAKLLLNECDFSEGFSQIITELQNKKVKLHALGLQTHMHAGIFPLGDVWELAERFARFGLPLHFTELSILSGHCEGKVDYYSQNGNKWITSPASEEKQAQQAVDMYTLLFGHPAVEAITWWDLVDGQWLMAPSGLVSSELEPKPVYAALMNLIKGEWWTDVSLSTDIKGQCTANAFFGTFDISVSYNGNIICQQFVHSKCNIENSIINVML